MLPDRSARGSAHADAVGLSGDTGHLNNRGDIAGQSNLTLDQLHVWVGQALVPGSPVYHVALALNVFGEVEPARFEQAFQTLINSCDALRTVIEVCDGVPQQSVLSTLTYSLECVDVSQLADPRGAAKTWMHERCQMPLDVTRRLFDSALIKIARNEFVWYLNCHHLIVDGASFALIYRRLDTLYTGALRGTLPARVDLPQFQDYVESERRYRASSRYRRVEAYWAARLSRRDEPLSFYRRAGVKRTTRARRVSCDLGEERTRRLRAVAGSEESGTAESALFGIFASALITYLHGLHGHDAYSIGVPIHNRRSPRLKETIGFFSEVLPIRVQLDRGETFASLRHKVRAQIVEVIRHGPYALPNRPQRNAYDVVLNYHPYGFARLNDMTATPEWLHTGHGYESLTVQIQDFTFSGSMVLDFDFHCDVFNYDQCERAVQHFLAVLDAFLESPAMPLDRVGLLTPEERQRVLVAWNETRVDAPGAGGLHRLFEEQVGRTPDSIAVSFAGRDVGYAELNGRANQLARHLRRCGVGPGTIVGVYLDRSPDVVTSLLAVLKAGGAYLPLDPGYPKEWLSFVLTETRTSLVLTQATLVPGLALTAARPICLDSDWQEIASQSADNLSDPADPGHLAYVIYTSGSTGRPKGVEITHRGLVNFTTWAARTFELGPGDRVLQFASLSFDSAAEEIFPALVTGAALVLRTDTMLGSVVGFLQTCQEWGITVLDLPTAYWHELTDALATHDLELASPLRLMIIGGEAAQPERLAQWHKRVRGRVRLVNTYGPTETTVVASSCELTPGAQQETRSSDVPIGRPIANVTTYVLDDRLQPVPVGVRGELYIGGAGLARGYHARPDLSAERFVPNPFGDRPGERLYRTGDLARYRPDGQLEFLGRADSQVKVRGFRIETGEIEAALREHGAVRDVAVVCQETGPGDKRLAAYVVAAQASGGAGHDWRGYLRDRLPEYMLPAAFVQLEALPRTANGKVDRAALPPPDGATTELEFTEARSPLEELVTTIWCDVLDVARISVHANFFELGGHSLLATQVMSRLRETLKVEIPLRKLFDAPTIAGLAERVEAELRHRQQALETPPIASVDRDQDIPLSSSQRRMWFSHQLAPDAGAYNVAAPIRVTGVLHKDALARSATELIRRHESLRTTFPIIDGVPVQVITPPEKVKPREVDLRSLSEPDRLREAKRLLTEEAGQPFDVARGPLYRFLLVQVADEDHLLLMTLHHLISDAWSLGVIGREIAALYNGTLEALPTPAPQLPVQYVDFAVWHGQRIEGEALEAQLSYWKEQLAGVPMLELPADHPRPAVQTFHGAHVGLDLPVRLLEELTRLSVRERVTVFMTLLAVFKIFLHRYTGQADIAIGVPIANRHWRAIEDTIGTFVNTLVMRTDLSEHPTFRELLGRVREVALDAYANQDMPFERLVGELQPHRDSSRPPLVSVHFNLQNAPIREVNLRGLSWTPFEIDAWASQFDVSLTVDVAILKKMFFIYNSDLFERATVERMLRHYRNLLEAVVAHPETRISDLPLLTDAERRQQLVEWNATAVPYPADRCFHHLFEAQAARTPDAIAVECGPRHVTYRELNARANQLAHHLCELGVGPETRVGVCLERSIDMVASLLGIMKAGGAYVPLDPDLPTQRIAFMLQDSDPVAVLTEARLARVLPEHNARVVWIGGDETRISGQPRENPRSAVGPAHLAYVIYTSGSTGTPKGVEVAHRALVNLLESMRREPGLSEDDVLLSVTPLSFDIAALELYLPLRVGGRLVIASRETSTDGRRLAEAIETSGATVMQATPASWRLLLQAGWRGRPRLKILCGGEALSADLADALMTRSASLWNVYGPTETTIWSTVWKVEPSRLSIGRPIANTQVYILDASGQPVPLGVPGELYIGGDGVARGYLRRPELTAGKFVPDPFGEPGTRLFRTGDLASYLPDGNIRFLGRIDTQVKIHGHRIELGEIEAVLARHPAVHHAVVIAHEDVPGDKRLAAYLVLWSGRVVTTDELRLALMRELPAYMVPSAFVFLDCLPLTPSGKIDRRSLPAPDPSRVDSPGHLVAPRDHLELQLVKIWEKLLGKEGVGIRDDFFELGGHSLLAARLFVEIERSLGKYLPVATLFQAPTVEQLAQVMREEVRLPSWASLVELQRKGSKAPFFWVHGDASSLLLGRHLNPDQPLYGFDHQAADGNPAQHVTVEDIAGRYLKELRTVQAEGPYVLGGYSFGAVVAFEMAQQLQDAGQRVALLLMLYPSVPDAGFWAPPQRRRSWPHPGAIADEVRRNLRELAQLGSRRKLRRIAQGVGARIRARIQPHAITMCLGLGLRLPPSLRSRYILGIYFRALRRYVPRSYRGAALVFVETAFSVQEQYWLNLLTGNVEIHRLAAGHGEITTPPHLEAWAEPLRDRLQRIGADVEAWGAADRRR